jgi:hypothetical protein
MSVARSDASPMPADGPSTLAADMAPHLERLAQLAAAHEGNPLELLSLLRQLESLHRTIQDGPFRSSLPSDRSSLFRLLQDMERSGGWPYIPRLQLRTFLDLLQADGPSPQQDPPSRDLPPSIDLTRDSHPLEDQEGLGDTVAEAA